MIIEDKVKTAPNSKESEMMVLSCMLSNPSNLEIAAEELNECDFYYTEHKIIFQSLKSAYRNNKPIDTHLLCEDLKKLDKLKAVGGTAYIVSLAQYAGTSAYIEEYIHTIQEKTARRRGLEQVQKLFDDLLDEQKPLSNILEKAEAEIA